jgi:hypothetical protein
MKEDIAKVLRMVEEGKITSDEAGELIAAIKEEMPTTVTEQGTLGKMLKVRITSAGKENVRVSIPIRFVKWMIKTGHGIASSIPEARAYAEDIDMDLIMHAIDSEMVGKIVDVETDDGQTIVIFIE